MSRAKTAARKHPRWVLGTIPRAPAGYVQPMQPQLVEVLPQGEIWRYECKWDGYRAIAVKRGDNVTLFTRRENDVSSRYPGIAQAVPCTDAVVDGEILAIDASGRPSFQLLQNYRTASGVPIAFMAFDLLNIDGYKLLDQPLEERQSILGELAAGSDVQVSEVISPALSKAIQAVEFAGMEGLVAKDRRSKYVPGSRGGTWFKHRFGKVQPFVIGGFKAGNPLESILIGYYDGAKLHYAAKVEAGFTPHIRRALYRLLAPLAVDRCPFVNVPQKAPGRWGEGLTAAKMAECTWVKPKLVCLVEFVEWTTNGSLRHPSFRGVDEGTRPRDVRRS